MNPTLKRLFSICLLSSMTQFAIAEININGFASVGGGWYNGDKTGASYRGYDQHFAADPVNKFGLQFSTAVNEQVMATAQLLSKGSKDYDIEAAWAFLTYAVNDDWDARAGRLRTPFFPYSDFLDVGYAYPWITPPGDVYRFIFDTVEGMDTIYRASHGDWDTTYQAYYGRLTDETVLGGEQVDLDLENFTGVNVTAVRDWLTLRASYNRAEFSVDSPTDLAALVTGLNGAGFTTAASALEVKDETGVFWGIGALIDYNDWLLNLEYTELRADQSAISGDDAWYVMLGKRVDEFTFHATYSMQEDDPDYSVIAEIPEGTPVLYDGARSAINSQDISAIILGVRYDFAPATAFKFEVTKAEQDHSNSDGTLVAFAVDTVF